MRKLLMIISVVFCSVSLYGQGYLSYYQLRDIVPQSHNLQPAFVPNNSFSISLIPSVGVNIQGDWKLEELLSRPNGQFDLTVDFDLLNEAAQENNFLSVDATVNLMHIGFKTKIGGFSLFANSRTNLDLKYNKDFIDFLANGNSNFIGESMDFSANRFRLDVFHEVGLGYANRFLNDKLTLGARVKMVTGLFHASVDDNASFTWATDAADFTWTMSFENATINTAGLEYLANSDDYDDSELTSYALSNQNSTVAFDFGAKYKVLDWLELEAAVNDIGTIDWKEQTKNYTVFDTTASFSGVELRNIENSEEVFQDELESRFPRKETSNAFSTELPLRLYLTASAYLTPNDRFSITYFRREAIEGMPANYALSYNHKFEKFIVGLMGLYRGAQNETSIGGNIATNFGPVQVFLATDNILLFNRPERYSKADFRFGLNLMFGYKKWKKTDGIVDLDKL